jgi:hypothetical protein
MAREVKNSVNIARTPLHFCSLKKRLKNDIPTGYSKGGCSGIVPLAENEKSSRQNQVFHTN